MTNRTAKQRRLLEDLFGSESDEEDEGGEEFNDFLESNDDRPQIRAQRRPNKERDHQGGHEKLMQDYFEQDATFNDADFERRFWKWGLSCFQKITSALRQLAYGCAMDATNE
ncbi:hypothetical protein PCANC_14038 [Puccinia coronata f. sp. avenae]|uniref:Uncharacterized protein n=1 Tax=Puccinia coronata f. sp. avenae TaxID=200324 RepID=A0A2N5VRJ6_9BASI|nr:hypothetical protein PCANC_14038 [Puccinia coronata f. sp. avenae]